jgi:hypothetical protein
MRLFRPLLERWRPEWTRPVVVEYISEHIPVAQGTKSRTMSFAIVLSSVSFISFLALFVQLFFSLDLFEIILIPPWVRLRLALAQRLSADHVTGYCYSSHCC